MISSMRLIQKWLCLSNCSRQPMKTNEHCIPQSWLYVLYGPKDTHYLKHQNDHTHIHMYNHHQSIINPFSVRVVGAPQMILQPVFSIFPCLQTWHAWQRKEESSSWQVRYTERISPYESSCTPLGHGKSGYLRLNEENGKENRDEATQTGMEELYQRKTHTSHTHTHTQIARNGTHHMHMHTQGIHMYIHSWTFMYVCAHAHTHTNNTHTHYFTTIGIKWHFWVQNLFSAFIQSPAIPAPAFCLQG